VLLYESFVRPLGRPSLMIWQVVPSLEGTAKVPRPPPHYWHRFESTEICPMRLRGFVGGKSESWVGID
jgi:hypothetical protein